MMEYRPLPQNPAVPLIHRGKVRDTFQLAGGHRLMVATDRMSTHNIVHHSTFPGKGEVLTMLTVHWLTEALGLSNHLVAWGAKIYDFLPSGVRDKYPDLHYRAIVVESLDMVPLEFIVRRHITGSLHKAYREGRDPYGLRLPPGLVQMSRFDNPIFTPTDKSDTDEPLDARTVALAHKHATSMCLEAFMRTEHYLAGVGICLVDSKLEVGVRRGGATVLADEVFTPDSSRFVMLGDVREGVEPPWLDKQLVRDKAERLWAGGPKVPLTFDSAVIKQTTDAYGELLKRITGRSLGAWRQKLSQTR